MCKHCAESSAEFSRRGFLYAAGAVAAGAALHDRSARAEAAATPDANRTKTPATVRVAFLYPPTEELKKEGYYSWPGSGFDAEGHHRQYLERITAMAKELGIRLAVEEKALTGPAVDAFIASVKADAPDGLLLIPFKKSEWPAVQRIIEQTGIPTVAVATMGLLLMPHIHALKDKPGVRVISSLDNFDAIRDGLNMIRVRRWLRDAVILSIANEPAARTVVPVLGTRIQHVPMARYADLCKSTTIDDEVKEVARRYSADAQACREPGPQDVLDAAQAHVALKRLIEQEKGDAMMMVCLDGIAKRLIPPPCMSFMDLRDVGIVAGCQNDLDATLTMMIGQELLGRPGFQFNPACDTEKNLFYGSHCTCPRKLEGPKGPAQSYILRNHAEAGIGTVPQVLWPVGMDVTIAQYVAHDKPRMHVYSGKIVANNDTPPAGGCRTSVMTTINEVPACQVKVENMCHGTMFAGNSAKLLRSFCQLLGVETTT